MKYLNRPQCKQSFQIVIQIIKLRVDSYTIGLFNIQHDSYEVFKIQLDSYVVFKKQLDSYVVFNIYNLILSYIVRYSIQDAT